VGRGRPRCHGAAGQPCSVVTQGALDLVSSVPLGKSRTSGQAGPAAQFASRGCPVAAVRLPEPTPREAVPEAAGLGASVSAGVCWDKWCPSGVSTGPSLV